MLCATPLLQSSAKLQNMPAETHLGRKWFDCAECHQEQEDHALLQRFEMIFACKKCKKCFRKDAREFDER